MPLIVPVLDNRTQVELIDEVQARIAVHTPEWTNRLESDPGVTLIEVFAFLTENLLYRSNFIPERNRLKFLSLLGVPLYEGAAARALVTFANERGPRQPILLNSDLEVRADDVPYRTDIGVDVLPIETRFYIKRKLMKPDPAVLEYYRQLYTSFSNDPMPTPILYETVPFIPRGTETIDLGRDAIDSSLWIALLLRSDTPANEESKKEMRDKLKGRILSLGIIPQLSADSRRLAPGMALAPDETSLLQVQMPDIPETGLLPKIGRRPQYMTLPVTPTDDVLARPGILQITLPSAEKMRLWSNLEPLESGAGDFPPSLEDTALDQRVITWIRITAPKSVKARLLWVGANAATVNQRALVIDERLPDGTGEPDQSITLAHTPVIASSIKLKVNGDTWERIDDLFAAGPEVATPNPRNAPGSPPPPKLPSRVFALDAEAGTVRFGDGTRGARPPQGATVRVTYHYSVGRRGNVGPEAINVGPALPAGIQVVNTMPAWGGADRETVADGEKQITRFVQHRDRLVTAADFETITLRTPGVEIGRVDVLPTYNPELGSSEGGDAPGAVTLMLIPRYDPVNPNAPMPDRLFMDAICKHIDDRRLVTTEVFLRPPDYKPVWVSIGLNVAPRQGNVQLSTAQVIEAVKVAVTAFFSPLPPPGMPLLTEGTPLFAFPLPSDGSKGWPLRKPVYRQEISAVASRVPGVLLVNGVMLFGDARQDIGEIPMSNLQLPYLAGIAVGIGAPPDPSQIPGFTQPAAIDESPVEPSFVAVPVIPEECA